MKENKVILITGGNRGIGASVSERFAKEGYHIALISRSGSSTDHLKKLEKFGVEVLDLKGDVSDFSATKILVDKVKDTFGRIDVLVNNAGITDDTLLIRMKESSFDDVININLKGTFNMLRHVSKIMLKQRSGAIVNMASLSGEIGNAGQINYSASKAGVIAMTKSAARELAVRGIRVNAVAPGFIESDMTDKLSDKVKDQMVKQVPLGRFGETEDIAEAVLFLVNSNYITGTTLDVNGGLYMN